VHGGTKARVARASRIFVEGRHDAELVEKVWGDDLRIEGVVVEYLDGVDDLSEHLRDFGPGPSDGSAYSSTTWCPARRRAGSRRPSKRSPVGKHVLIVGHPYIDVWAAVKPVGSARARGPTSPATSSGRRASASASAGRTATRPTSPAPGSTSSAG
jgi:hypothetical protein